MCSELELSHQHWLGAQVFENSCGGTALNFAGKTTTGAYKPSWSTSSIADIMMAAAIQQSAYGFSSIRSCQEQRFIRSTGPDLDAQIITEVRANQALHMNEAERAENSDADDAESEAGSDRSRYLSDDSESEDDYGLQENDDDEASEKGLGEVEELESSQWNDFEEIEESEYVLDDDNDTSMTNLDTISSTVYVQPSIPSAVTDRKKKPRHYQISRKRVSSRLPPGLPVSIPDMDVDMDAVVEEGCYSSEDEDAENYVYSSWFKDIYHPMWLGHASTSGKKRRDKTNEDEGVFGTSQDQENPLDSVIVTEVAKRQIKKPSSRRKRAWNESWGTRSSAAESDCSLIVNQPMPLPASNAGAMPSPAVASSPITAISPVQMHTAPRTTQPRSRQNPARVLEHRLGKLWVEDMNRRNSTTTVSTTNSINNTANDSRPRRSLDRQEKKRPRYAHTASFDVTSMDITEGEANINIPLFWDIVEEPTDFRSSGMGEQLDASGFEMIGVEGGMTSIGGFDRVKDISKILGNVDELL